MPFVNTTVTFPISLKYDDTPFVPISLTLTVNVPGGGAAVYTLSSPEMVNQSTGVYSVEYFVDRPGAWYYAWSAVKAGGREFYDEGTVIVKKRLAT